MCNYYSRIGIKPTPFYKGWIFILVLYTQFKVLLSFHSFEIFVKEFQLFFMFILQQTAQMMMITCLHFSKLFFEVLVEVQHNHDDQERKVLDVSTYILPILLKTNFLTMIYVSTKKISEFTKNISMYIPKASNIAILFLILSKILHLR